MICSDSLRFVKEMKAVCMDKYSVKDACVWQVKFQGTVVTIENFLAWKAKFELEMAEFRRKKQKEEEQAGKPRLTGKSVSLLCQSLGSCLQNKV